MNLGNSLFHARKRRGLSQEDVAEKLGVSRQTISKWELGKSIPDEASLNLLYQCLEINNEEKTILQKLIDFDINTAEIQEMIKKSGEKADEKINWTNEWGKKYPILLTYQGKVNIPNYAYRIKTMLDELEQEYKFNAQDAMLVFKDILYNVWKERSGSR